MRRYDEVDHSTCQELAPMRYDACGCVLMIKGYLIKLTQAVPAGKVLCPNGHGWTVATPLADFV